ncbi:MAG: HlyD family efflux transporter periplasmic adaptor subunit [Alphaproteobacteria bacterium]|nr:HlyD family efflux transporter periplasmic adaptor subunit [Alphaproteobacteria bacterium]
MNAAGRRWIIWGVLGAALVAGLVYAFRPQPIPVELAAVARGPLVVTVDEEGETRVRDVFILSAPIDGFAQRIDADVGDPVKAGTTVIAQIEPEDPGFLDIRTETEARAAISAAEAARELAVAELKEVEAELDFARSELKRARALVAKKHISESALDDARRLFRLRSAELETAKAGLRMREFELERARSKLVSPVETFRRREACGDCIPIHAPIDGTILKVHHESEGVVRAGDPLVDIGDPADLEIVVDFLSSDAVKVAADQRVIIEEWGGLNPLEGRVRRVEPYGFTKISALGIEEQRVNVIIDFTSPRADWERLGHGYQVEVKVVLWEGTDVQKLPVTALFRNGGDWAVFVEQEGEARLRPVKIGRRTSLEAEILEGVDVGDRVVDSPNDRVVDGVGIRPRT